MNNQKYDIYVLSNHLYNKFLKEIEEYPETLKIKHLTTYSSPVAEISITSNKEPEFYIKLEKILPNNIGFICQKTLNGIDDVKDFKDRCNSFTDITLNDSMFLWNESKWTKFTDNICWCWYKIEDWFKDIKRFIKNSFKFKSFLINYCTSDYIEVLPVLELIVNDAVQYMNREDFLKYEGMEQDKECLEQMQILINRLRLDRYRKYPEQQQPFLLLQKKEKDISWHCQGRLTSTEYEEEMYQLLKSAERDRNKDIKRLWSLYKKTHGLENLND